MHRWEAWRLCTTECVCSWLRKANAAPQLQLNLSSLCWYLCRTRLVGLLKALLHSSQYRIPCFCWWCTVSRWALSRTSVHSLHLYFHCLLVFLRVKDFVAKVPFPLWFVFCFGHFGGYRQCRYFSLILFICWFVCLQGRESYCRDASRGELCIYPGRTWTISRWFVFGSLAFGFFVITAGRSVFLVVNVSAGITWSSVFSVMPRF